MNNEVKWIPPAVRGGTWKRNGMTDEERKEIERLQQSRKVHRKDAELSQFEAHRLGKIIGERLREITGIKIGGRYWSTEKGANVRVLELGVGHPSAPWAKVITRDDRNEYCTVGTDSLEDERPTETELDKTRRTAEALRDKFAPGDELPWERLPF